MKKQTTTQSNGFMFHKNKKKKKVVKKNANLEMLNLEFICFLVIINDCSLMKFRKLNY